MNLGLFNRMNIKDSSTNKKMYSEWTSLSSAIQNYGEENKSVLEKFGLLTSKEVTLAIVKQLTTNLGITHPPEASPLITDKEVQWCMEVLCFGLSLPLIEHDSIKDCVNVYCEWLTALLPEPKICVPQPILDDPNVYCQKIVSHFFYLFIPRTGEGLDTINRQAVLCHRVLRTLKQIANDSKILNKETWEALLLFLIAVNETLLSSPTLKDDTSDVLGERTLSVLFEVWLIACAECFPSPTLWKTLRECCMNWRHRTALVEQWNRVNLALIVKILVFMYGPDFPELKHGDDDIISHPLSNDCIAQSWYRFLNIIGNPVCLTKPEVISQTQKFLHCAISNDVMDPCQHPCLEVLPNVFLKAIKGIAGQVDAFLGIAQPSWWELIISSDTTNKKESSPTPTSVHSPTPPFQRRLAKSFSVAPSSVTKGTSKTSLIGLTTSRASIPNATQISSNTSSTSFSSLSSFGLDSKQILASNRPKCNSIIHLFGEWLFDAAFIDTDCNSRLLSESSKKMNSMILDKNSLNYSQSSSLSELASLPQTLTIDKFESGRAEALGTLCRIICAKKTGEEILPVYLARFYLAVQMGLRIPSKGECSETMIAILTNSSDLFRLDLNGVRMLLPVFISALEMVLPREEIRINSTCNISKVELRRSCINILLSMLVLPLHFQNVSIKELVNSGSGKPFTFIQLKLRLMNLLTNALQIETNPLNTHMLLGGLFLAVLDSATFEKIEQLSQPQTEIGSNLLSSASDTASTASMASSIDHPTSLEHVEQNEPYDFNHQLSKDSAHALFLRATYLVCHRLISSWKTDLNISLAALELLSGLARIHIKESDAMECKRAVKWLCDYIVQQCSRPPQAHSKDLHSTIVAAFHCCMIWLLEHPYLLRDKECLQTVLEVVELGVSGTKSIGKPSESIKMKDEKELKPVSIRVRDAAENLLTCILEDVDCFPNECGPESTSSLLDELSLLQHCNPTILNRSEREAAVKHFRYFVCEGSVMIALLEDPLGNDQDPQPTVTLLIRGPFGRHAWTMQLRHLPRHKSSTKYHPPNPGRPVFMQDGPPKMVLRQKYFPDSVDRITQCKVDQSIPTLESVLSKNSSLNEDLDKIKSHLNKQTSAEANLVTQNTFQECSPPPVCHEYQTARLFLSHFGLLELDKDDDEGKTGLLELDSSMKDFCKDLSLLDNLSARTCDTVHIFYVKSQQSLAEDIIGNIRNQNGLSPYFTEFLHTLGWTVEIGKHPGWTGHVSTSWKLPQNSKSDKQSSNTTNKQNICYDGTEKVLYWADACSEIAFIVPSQLKSTTNDEKLSFNANSLSWCEQKTSEQVGRDKRALSLDLDKQTQQQPVAPKRSTHRTSLYSQINAKIMILWLENLEDHLNVPVTELLKCVNTGLEGNNVTKNSDVILIFIHEMETGLFRIHLQGPSGKVGLALPLINGMVVSRRSLGTLVRQTALNMARRQRLDFDNYQPPHVKRRVKIQEMVQRYKRNLSKPELLTDLFRDI